MSDDAGREAVEREVREWWRTEIIEMEPGVIRLRGYPVEDLIGRVGYAEMVWLLTRGELPRRAQARLLEAAMVAGVDHGPQAPGIAIARMAMTCGVGLNNAMASGLNVLGDVHGGAGEQALELYLEAVRVTTEGASAEAAAGQVVERFEARGGRYLPGFGHRYHPIDPRVAPLLALVDEAARAGEVEGRVRAVASAIEAEIERRKGHRIPMNIDGVSAVVYGELGFDAALARGLFCLSRSVGILAHAWEQRCQGGRNKGPTPKRFRWRYDGPPRRAVP